MIFLKVALFAPVGALFGLLQYFLLVKALGAGTNGRLTALILLKLPLWVLGFVGAALLFKTSAAFVGFAAGAAVLYTALGVSRARHMIRVNGNDG